MTDQQNSTDKNDEVEESDAYFTYSATLRIFGDTLDFDEISRRLGLAPTKTVRKGGRPVLGEVPARDMWQYRPPVDRFHHLEEHIDALWAAIKDSKDYLLELKKTMTVDVFLGYQSDSSTAGVTVWHTCLTMFIELEIPFSLSIIVI